ncbi:MAG: DMT family transporter [Candidatus Cloacimonetes bacterium]|nr:DMT family transporter [Candidatus Cloacimonadota bacterium]
MRISRAIIYAALAVLLWSTAASAFKISLRYLDYLSLLFYASLTSAVTLLLILAGKGKIKEIIRYPLKSYLRSFFMGFLNPFLYYVILFKAYTLLPAQLAQPLNFVWPLMIVILSVPLLRQKIGMKSLIAILISFLGVIVISTRGRMISFEQVNLKGVILALASSLVWAVFWILNMKDKRGEIQKLSLSFCFGTILTLVLILLTGRLQFPSAAGWTGAVYIGLFEMGITFVIWLKALQSAISTAQVNNFIYLTPFLSLFFINLLVGESIRLSTISGLILIVCGIVLQQSHQFLRFRRLNRKTNG